MLVPRKVQRLSKEVKGLGKGNGKDPEGFLEMVLARKGGEVFWEQGVKTHKAGSLLGTDLRCGWSRKSWERMPGRRLLLVFKEHAQSGSFMHF